MTQTNPSDIRVLAHSTTTIISDYDADAICLVEESGGARRSYLVAGRSQGINKPTGLTLVDQATVAVFNEGMKSVVYIDLSGVDSDRFASAAISGTHTFRAATAIVRDDNNVVWLLDPTSPASRPLIIPSLE